MKTARHRSPRFRLEELERRDTPTFNAAAPFFNGFGDPSVIAVGDFNNDGNADLAVGVPPTGTSTPAAVQVLLGDGTGAFTTGQSLPIPNGMTASAITTYRSAATNQTSIAVATLTVGSVPTPGGTITFVGNGTGNFVLPGVIVDNTPVIGIATGDFNGDGVDDLATVTSPSGYQIITQTAAGTFAVTDAKSAALDFKRLVVGDFDNDGHQDFAGESFANDSLIVFYGAGNGTVAQVVTTVIPSGVALFDLAAGDFNNDGTTDFLIVEDANVRFHQANTNRTIDAAGVDVPALATFPGSNVEHLAVADFNSDGIPDAVAQDENGNARVAVATSGGSFIADTGNPYPKPTGVDGSAAVIAANFNNDGAPDFVLTNFGSSTVPASGLVFFNAVPTTTTIVAAPNPSTFGNAVTFTATVQPASGTGVPTGTITFTIDGTPQTPITMTNGQASFTINSLDVGSHTVFADYSGATTFAASTSAVVDQVVNPADSTTTVVANPNPATYGDTVVLTATIGSLAGPGAANVSPTGDVTFTINGTTLGPVALSGNAASVNVPGLPAGTYPVTATYSGDTHFNGSSNNTTEVVNQAHTTTQQFPPASPLTAGQPLVVNVQVSGEGQNPGPTGQVELVDAGSGVVLGSGTLNPANGTATITVSTPPAGTHDVFTRYLGDTNFLTSASRPDTITVNAFTVLVTGSDHGEAVCLFSTDPLQRGGVGAFGPGITGIRPAAADFNLDGFTDVLVGSGPGDPSRVALMDGKTRSFVSSFSPFGDGFTGGVFVAAGDINGDGRPDIAASADVGGGTRVRVYLATAAGFTPVADFMGIDDANFRGGCRVAIGDVNKDGFADVVVGAGPGGGARIAGYSGAALISGRLQHVFPDFFAFDPSSRVGAFVAAGDVNGDGFAEVVVGADTGGAPRVTVFDGASLIAGVQKEIANFFAGPSDLRGGIRVAVRDFNQDGFADVITGPGGTDGSKQRIFNGKDVANGTPTLILERDPFPGLFFGIYVA